jgi:hypothetical protein
MESSVFRLCGGSGVLVVLSGKPLVVTAAHVVRTYLGKFAGVVPAFLDRKRVLLRSVRQSTGAVEDWALLEFVEEAVAESMMSSGRCVTVADQTPKLGSEVSLFGYSNSVNPNKAHWDAWQKGKYEVGDDFEFKQVRSEGKITRTDPNEIETTCQSDNRFSGGGAFVTTENGPRLIGVLSRTMHGGGLPTGDAILQPLVGVAGF